MEAPFRIATVVLLILVYGVSGYYRRRADRTGGALDTSQGGRMLVVLRLVALAGLTPLVLYLINPAWVGWARLPAPGWLRWLGVGVALAMVPAIVWLFRSIGTNVSPRETTRVGHQLVMSGPYRYIRHPLYTFGATFYVALALATALWPVLAVLVVGFTLLARRTLKEEQNLVARFGDDYRRYMAQTGRFLPRIGSPA
jgi:protein-S-isoprenylcysteine O-methyltransferase Ste14